MSSAGSASNLVQAARQLNIEWERTKTYWRDARAAEFEKNYMSDLAAQVSSTTNAMEELDLLLKRVRNDCE